MDAQLLQTNATEHGERLVEEIWDGSIADDVRSWWAAQPPAASQRLWDGIESYASAWGENTWPQEPYLLPSLPQTSSPMRSLPPTPPVSSHLEDYIWFVDDDGSIAQHHHHHHRRHRSSHIATTAWWAEVRRQHYLTFSEATATEKVTMCQGNPSQRRQSLTAKAFPHNVRTSLFLKTRILRKLDRVPKQSLTAKVTRLRLAQLLD